MKVGVSINTLCFPPAPLANQLNLVAQLGVAGVSPDLIQVTEYGVRETATALRDTGLKVATLTHRAFAYATTHDCEQGRDRLLRTLDIAQEIGAESVIMTTGGRGGLTWREAVDRFADAVAPCAAMARAAGITLGIEPTSHLYADSSIAHSLSDTVTIAKQAQIGVMIDIFACWSDADIEDAIAAAVPMSPVVQVSDYVYGDRSLPCRTVPGDGAVPFGRLVPLILRSGFEGWFDLEIIGPRLLQEGTEAGLRRAVGFLTGLIDGN